MLLKANANTDETTGKTYLDMWLPGGEHKPFVKPPFDPFFYTKNQRNVTNVEAIQKILLSNQKLTEIYKYSFQNTELLRMNRGDEAWEDMPFEQKIAILKGFVCKSLPITNDGFDLEIKCRKGILPNCAIDPLLAISHADGNGFGICESTNQYPEYEIIHRFRERIKERNPDIISSYWGSFADWRWLMQRCDVLGIKFDIGRDGTEPWISVRTFQAGKRSGEDRTVHIAGRLHFDVWKEVNMDTDLLGIKNHQLKTVGTWFHYPVIRVKYSELNDMPDDKMREYCLMDSKITVGLANMYLANLIPLGEMLRIPLEMVIERHPSHVPNLFYGREFDKKNIVSNGYNNDRFPVFAQKGYQAALVGLFKAGLYEHPKHADFKSMYPNILATYNYSPETLMRTKIYDMKYEAGKWVEFGKMPGDIRVYDEKLGLVQCMVNMDEVGVTKERIEGWLKWREELKKEMAERKNAGLDFSDLKSRQWGVKIIMNTLSGYQGMPYARYGSFPLIVQTCAHGRKYITAATDRIIQNKGQPIQRHTDGIHYIGENWCQDIVDDIIKTIPDCYTRENIKVEYEEFDMGIFYDNTGYVLKDGNKLSFHGVGLKGKRQPLCVDHALERIVNAVFDKAPIESELREAGKEIRKESIDGFLMIMSLRKDPEDYCATTFSAKIIEKAKAAGVDFRWGDEIEYISTPSGYQPYCTLSEYEINFKYYVDRAAATLERILETTHGMKKKIIAKYLRGEL